MSGSVLLDTNLWVYLYSKKPTDKYEKVSQLFLPNIQSLIISTQILGELYNVLVKKKLQTRSQAQEIILQLVDGFDILEIDAQKVLKALEVSAGYGYSYWDSLIIGTALLSDCAILYSEDMKHNQLIEENLKIINPLI